MDTICNELAALSVDMREELRKFVEKWHARGNDYTECCHQECADELESLLAAQQPADYESNEQKYLRGFHRLAGNILGSVAGEPTFEETLEAALAALERRATPVEGAGTPTLTFDGTSYDCTQCGNRQIALCEHWQKLFEQAYAAIYWGRTLASDAGQWR